ncbi:OLC1v1006830C1 [Oldenlandia corymbosa var. corymbosa]|uniref:OLC1v1006830C1 n=1 Tax=Oldenlandia corymbosa var. corymbosa TaxID=529605 RepID=A0AAV1DHY0_OLDCO|nr:OLC1v1006830C1 [Oldenlandia corymbosa var. corymbosa]
MIGQDPQPISSEDSVKKFETRMTPNHLFQLITEINKPTDLKEEPDATGARQVPLNGNNVLDIKQEDVVAVLDLPHGPKPVEEFKQNDPSITDHAEMVDAFKKRMGYSNKFLPTRSTAAQLIAGRKDFGDDFKRDFVVFVVSTSLHGNTTSRITMNILKSLVNINEVTQYNWCQYVIDALVKGCKSHHDGKPFTGPITFFLLCYLDKCEYERAHPRSFPVIKSWDQKMLDDRIRLQGSNFTDIQTLEHLKKPSSAASRDEQPEAESQEDTQGNPNTQQVYDLAALYEKFYQLIITMSKTVLDIREKEMELKIEPGEQAMQTIKILTDAMVSMSRKMPPSSEQLQRQVADQQQQQQQHQQTDDNTVQAPINPTNFQDIEIDKTQGLEQLSQTNDEASLVVGKSVPTSKEVVVDEQQTQPQGAQGLDQLSQTNDENSLPVGKSVPTSKEVVVDEQQTQPQDNYDTTQEKNTQEDITGSVDLDKDVNETIEAEEYPVPSALDETKNPTPSIDEIIRRASAPALESLSDTKKLEMIAAVAEQVEKNPKVVEAVPLSIIPRDWNITSTTGGLLMLDKNECTMPPPAISKKADVLDERLTKTVEKNFLFEFGKIVWADKIAFYSMGEGTWIENNIIDAWAVILNKEEAKSDSPRWIFFGVSSFSSTGYPSLLCGGLSMIHLLVIHLFCTTYSQDLNWLTISSCLSSRVLLVDLDTINRYYQSGSNKEEIEFTFYERLALELEEQGLSVASLIAAKAIYFPVYYRDHYFLYVLLVEEKKVIAFNNLHAKDLDYYKPTKDILFRFFQMFLQCVFPHIELVTAQYTLTEVTLPSHKDKMPNTEDCGIYTMHHIEWYDGGEYEDGTVLDFNTGNIKEYRWKYMLKILMHPSNKNKDKILEAMHQFYTNTAEEEQKEISDHVDLSSKSYYNDRKIQGWVK